jgi:hypothetical protein
MEMHSSIPSDATQNAGSPEQSTANIVYMLSYLYHLDYRLSLDRFVNRNHQTIVAPGTFLPFRPPTIGSAVRDGASDASVGTSCECACKSLLQRAELEQCYRSPLS